MIDIPSFALELRIQRQLMLIENSLAEARLHSFAWRMRKIQKLVPKEATNVQFVRNLLSIRENFIDT